DRDIEGSAKLWKKLWSVSVRKKRNSHRNGRIRRHSRDCA
ncbi:unnamed protein product, partial [Tetraodon nigroviridis]